MMTDREKIEVQSMISNLLEIPSDNVCFIPSPEEGNDNVLYMIRTEDEDIMLVIDEVPAPYEIIEAIES